MSDYVLLFDPCDVFCSWFFEGEFQVWLRHGCVFVWCRLDVVMFKGRALVDCKVIYFRMDFPAL